MFSFFKKLWGSGPEPEPRVWKFRRLREVTEQNRGPEFHLDLELKEFQEDEGPTRDEIAEVLIVRAAVRDTSPDQRPGLKLHLGPLLIDARPGNREVAQKRARFLAEQLGLKAPQACESAAPWVTDARAALHSNPVGGLASLRRIAHLPEGPAIPIWLCTQERDIADARATLLIVEGGVRVYNGSGDYRDLRDLKEVSYNTFNTTSEDGMKDYEKLTLTVRAAGVVFELIASNEHGFGEEICRELQRLSGF